MKVFLYLIPITLTQGLYFNRFVSGGSEKTWSGKLTAWGQLSRMAIAHRRKGVTLGNIWKPGRLFILLTDLELLNIFHLYYSCRACDGTVEEKMRQIESFSNAAHDFFKSGNDEVSDNILRDNSFWLKAKANIHKNNYRKQKKGQQCVNERAELLKVLSEGDFENLVRTAAGKLESLMKDVNRRTTDPLDWAK